MTVVMRHDFSAASAPPATGCRRSARGLEALATIGFTRLRPASMSVISPATAEAADFRRA